MRTYSPLILLVFIPASSFVGCSRALVGVNQTGTDYQYTYESFPSYSPDHEEGDKAGKKSSGKAHKIINCKEGYSPRSGENVTGDFLQDECGEAGYNTIFRTSGPNIGLESEQTFLGDSNFGLVIFFQPGKYSEAKLLHFPADNKTTDVRFTARFVAIPIYYLWGDKDLGANGNWAIRFGFSPQFLYYDPIKISSEGITEEIRIQEIGGISYFFTWDWGNFSLGYEQVQPGTGVELKKFKRNGEKILFQPTHETLSINYAFYF